MTSFFHEPWIRRAAIASTLLDAAYMFTFRDENFAYYLTDISSDNIAVDSKNRAKFVDLENVIIVDKMTSVEGILYFINIITFINYLCFLNSFFY